MVNLNIRQVKKGGKRTNTSFCLGLCPETLLALLKKNGIENADKVTSAIDAFTAQLSKFGLIDKIDDTRGARADCKEVAKSDKTPKKFKDMDKKKANLTVENPLYKGQKIETENTNS